MKLHGTSRFAERELRCTGDDGVEERILVWIERKPGAVWAVGRAIDLHHRPTDDPRADDYVFEGYELEDALSVANDCLEDDVVVLERDGREVPAKPFTRSECLKPLERAFFGR
jgi:hypothetical protein